MCAMCNYQEGFSGGTRKANLHFLQKYELSSILLFHTNSHTQTLTTHKLSYTTTTPHTLPFVAPQNKQKPFLARGQNWETIRSTWSASTAACARVPQSQQKLPWIKTHGCPSVRPVLPRGAKHHHNTSNSNTAHWMRLKNGQN